jgi:uncharacterized protein YyaL (SSP411 family)
VGDANGVLEDYAGVANSALALLAVTGDPEWLTFAGRLLERVLDHFVADGTFYDTADDAEALVWRPQEPTDNATPSGVSLAAEALTTYGALTGSTRHRQAAEQALAATAGVGTQAPRFAGRALAVAETIQGGPLEIAIAGESTDLLRVALGEAPWGSAVVTGTPDNGVPLLAGRPLADGLPTAYVCQDFVCRLPVTTPADLRAQF